MEQNMPWNRDGAPQHGRSQTPRRSSKFAEPASRQGPVQGFWVWWQTCRPPFRGAKAPWRPMHRAGVVLRAGEVRERGPWPPAAGR